MYTNAINVNNNIAVSMEPVSATAKPLAPASQSWVRPEIGSVTVSRDVKQAGDKTVKFKVDFQQANGGLIHFEKTMDIVEKNDHINKAEPSPTFGFSDIEFPEGMKHKRIIYPMLSLVAKTAQELNIKNVLIDNVVTPDMESVCTRLETKVTWSSGGYAKTEAMLASLQKCNAEFEWNEK